MTVHGDVIREALGEDWPPDHPTYVAALAALDALERERDFDAVILQEAEGRAAAAEKETATLRARLDALTNPAIPCGWATGLMVCAVDGCLFPDVHPSAPAASCLVTARLLLVCALVTAVGVAAGLLALFGAGSEWR